MHKKFNLSTLTAKIISIFAGLAILITGTVVPLVAANASEGANDNIGVDTTAVLNGSDAGLRANDSQIIPATGDFTVETWVQNGRASSTNHFNILAQSNVGSANIGPEQFVIQTFDNQVRVYVGNQYLDSGINLAQNVWYHIAASVARTGSDLTLSIYVNGAYAAIKTFPVLNTGLSTYTPGNDFWVGSNPVQPSSEFWSGKIDQIKVWNDDLTEAQITESMHVYSSIGVTAAPTLSTLYDFNEGSNTDGKIYNRQDAAKDLVINTSANISWADVAESVSGGNIDSNRTVVYKFPRTYLNASGGWTVPANFTSVEALTVGAGGGGGENVGNGGSGGSIAYHSGFALPSGSVMAVKVGQGGHPGVLVDDTMSGTTSATWLQNSTTGNTAVVSTQRDGGNGQSSSLTVGSVVLDAPGGTGGQTYWDNNRCDGGVGAAHTAANTPAAAAGTGGTINAVGGTGGQGYLAASTGVGAAGWNSSSNVISGSAYKFGAGGAGADGSASPTAVSGGADGGGTSSAVAYVRGGNGVANSGSGGSGGTTSCTPGGAGGSGVVYIRTSAVKINAISGSGNSIKTVSGIVSGPTGNFSLALSSDAGALNISAGDLTTSGATKTAGGTGTDKFITYKGTIAQLHAALNLTKLTLQATTGTGSIKYELNPIVADSGTTFFNDKNAHYYKAVTTTADWPTSKTNAESSGNNLLGLNGYLTNVTSASEKDFIYATYPTTSTMWSGGYYNGTSWIWEGGPEAGTIFWSGNNLGTAVAGQYANWGTGEPNSTQNRAVVNWTSSAGVWDNQDASITNNYLIEYGGRTTDKGVTSAVVTVTLSTVNVNFTELNFDYTAGKYVNLKKLNVSGTDATTSGSTISATDSTGKAIGDRVLFKAVTVRNGITVDAIVTTKTVKDAAVKNYEAGTNAGGAATNFQADVDINAINGYAEFQFEFFQTDANIVANCNATIACTGTSKVILENVNISIIDIDYFQWNDVNAVESYTVSNPTNIKECLLSSLTSTSTCTARVAQNSVTYPANFRFQGPDSIDSTLPQDMAIMNFGQVETFNIKFGRSKAGTPNYYGIAFKALPWGTATPATNGPVAQSYTITYDGNGKTSGTVPASHTGVVGTNFTTSGNTGSLVKTGYTFGGWNTAADGGGTTYAATSAILMPKDGLTLYAIWTASQYTLTYNANNGTGAPASELRNAGSVANLSASAPTRSGYTFAGWTPNADGTGTNTSAGGSYTMPGANTTLYAKWTLVTTTIAYNGNSSTGGSVPSSTTAAAGSSTTTAVVGTLERSGYTFAGWNTAANGTGTDYAAGVAITYPGSGTTTLYAQWTAVVYSLSYNANGGTNAVAGAAPTQTANFGSTLTLAGSTYNPTRDGFTFAGWYTTASGTGGTLYNPAANNYSMPAANTVLYAKWTAVTYNVTYNGNAPQATTATGTPTDATAYGLNASVTAANKGSLTVGSGYRFTGWNTAANGTGTDYVQGATFSMPLGGITLYAKWVDANIVLTYDANGGVNAPAADTHTANTAITLPSQTPTRPGYTFLGWTEASNNSGTVYNASGAYTTPASNGVLYAKWAAISYTFYYNANGGTAGAGAPASVTGLNVGGLVTVYVVDVNNPAPTRSGYSFTGWNAATDGTSTNYAGGSNYTMGASNYTIYAQWLGNPFTLTYNSNGGTAISPTSEVRRADSVSNITGTTPTRSGYTFSSWNTAANGSGTTYASSSSLTMPASNVTLYAQWTALNNGVSYNANGGSGAPTGANYNFGASVTVSPTVPTRVGYTFIGWNTQQGGGGTSYLGNEVFTMPNAAVVLYAQWATTSFTLDYDANGGAAAPGVSNFAFGSTATVSSTLPTRNGYDFQGWNTVLAGTGTARAAAATFTMPANNVTLYAQWSLATYTVYYNANGGSGSINPQPGRYNATVTLSSSVPTRSGYTFAGWNTATDGSGVDYSSNGSLTIPASNVTLYAKWNPISYTLTYDANGGTSAPAAEANKTVAQTFALVSTSSVARTGYWFSGWNTQADGSGTNYASGANFTMPASNVTLYAKWVVNTFTVSYNANGGTGAPAAQSTGGGNVTVPSSTASVLRPGYTFSHWYTTPSGTGGTQYAPGATFTPSGNVVLYAIWTPLTITVHYDINGGANPNTDTPADQTATYDGQPIQLAGSTGFSKASSTFLTWNTVADGSGTSYAAEDPNFRVPSSNITLYAIWSAEYFAVEYKPNGGTGAPGDQFAAPGETVNVAPAEPQKAGYEFVAWSDVKTGNTYSANAAITMPTSNVTLVANWVVKSASVPGGSAENGKPVIGLTYPKKLNLTVYFKGDRSYLIPATVTKLKKLAATAKQYGYATNITIYGRVKETNDKSYDAKLSKARAINVAAYLKKLGVKGVFKIIPAGISPENKAISRRVDMTLFWNKR